ncbi:MAG: hypothetical protein HY757_09355 [Nitrospirae bacterium]|nr:hypothetical protein [Nitrospirota bacterium]
MIKKILIITLLSVMFFQSAAFALETEGELIFKDALYGAAIGAILGGAIYLADSDHVGEKLGVGIAIGTLGGLFYGVAETKGFAEIEKDKIKFAVPAPVIEKKRDGVQYSATLLKAKF